MSTQRREPPHLLDTSPSYAVVLAVVARAAPHGAVRAVEHDGGDGAGGALLEGQLVAHAAQLRTHPRGHRLGEQDAARPRLVRAEGAAHLEAVDDRSLDGLLHGHAELDDVEEELQEVVILTVAALHGEGEVGLAFAERERRRQRDARVLARLDDVEGVLGRVCDEALRALTQAYPRPPR